MNNESPAALLPCPFCGHANYDMHAALHPTQTLWVDCTDGVRRYLSRREADNTETDGIVWSLSCLGREGGCGVQMLGDSKEAVIEKWNHRTSTDPVASESRASVPDGWPYNEAEEYTVPFIGCDNLPSGIAITPLPDRMIDVYVTLDGMRRLATIDLSKWAVSYAEKAIPTPPAVASGEPTAELPSRFFYEAALELAHKHASMSRDEFHRACEQRARELARSAAAKGEG